MGCARGRNNLAHKGAPGPAYAHLADKKRQTQARAVLRTVCEAMQEPTDAMRDASQCADVEWPILLAASPLAPKE